MLLVVVIVAHLSSDGLVTVCLNIVIQQWRVDAAQVVTKCSQLLYTEAILGNVL